MLNLNKEAKALESVELRLSNCPVCSSYVSHVYFMQDSKTKTQSKWFSCSCGVVYQDKMPKSSYDRKYWDKYEQFDLKLKDAYEYPIRIYLPLIEELIYGRKALIVGRTTNHQHRALEARGWVTYSLDKNPDSDPIERGIIGDIESYEFPEGTKFNLVFFYHTLECLKDPLKTLSRLPSILAEDGIILLCTPDTDFINTRSSSSFIHWKPDDHYLMWNRRSLTSYLEKLGFNVIMARQNYEHRFPAWDDIHLIAQRKFF